MAHIVRTNDGRWVYIVSFLQIFGKMERGNRKKVGGTISSLKHNSNKEGTEKVGLKIVLNSACSKLEKI